MPQRCFSTAFRMRFGCFSEAIWRSAGRAFGGHLEVYWKGFRRPFESPLEGFSEFAFADISLFRGFLQQKCSFIAGLFLPTYPFAAIYLRLLLGEILARGCLCCRPFAKPPVALADASCDSGPSPNAPTSLPSNPPPIIRLLIPASALPSSPSSPSQPVSSIFFFLSRFAASCRKKAAAHSSAFLNFQ